MIIDTDELYWDKAPFIAFDTETTGFSREDRICEIAMVVMKEGRMIDSYHTLIDPRRPIDPGAQAVHGISDDDVRGKPLFNDVKEDILRLFRTDMPWVAHNLSFDTRMLGYELKYEEIPRGIYTLCTMDYSRKRHLTLKLHKKHKLLDLAGILGINYDPEAAHNAMNDSELLGKIVPVMMSGCRIQHHFTKYSQEWFGG